MAYLLRFFVGLLFQRWRSLILYVDVLYTPVLLHINPSLFFSNANASHRELSVNLEKVQLELNDARVDKHESARQQKKRETLDSMKRLFPGVYGRLMDHCEPKNKK